jgi:hypothetical protein
MKAAANLVEGLRQLEASETRLPRRNARKIADCAPLGVQAAENYLQSQQAPGMTLRLAWRF